MADFCWVILRAKPRYQSLQMDWGNYLHLNKQALFRSEMITLLKKALRSLFFFSPSFSFPLLFQLP